MTPQEAKKMLEAKLECFKNETSGINHDCNMRLCDDCSLNYEQGNMGEQKEALEIAIKALEQQSCEKCEVGNPCLYCEYDFTEKKTKEPSEDCISREAVKDMLTETWTKYVPMELDVNLSFVLEKISELPSVTPHYNLEQYSDKLWKNAYERGKAEQTEWIPVSDPLNELPKDRILYVTTKFECVETLFYDMTEWSDVDIARNTIAYMDYYEPQPYSESEE